MKRFALATLARQALHASAVEFLRHFEQAKSDLQQALRLSRERNRIARSRAVGLSSYLLGPAIAAHHGRIAIARGRRNGNVAVASCQTLTIFEHVATPMS